MSSECCRCRNRAACSDLDQQKQQAKDDPCECFDQDRGCFWERGYV